MHMSQLRSRERLELLTLAQAQALPEDLQGVIGRFVLNDIQTKHENLKVNQIRHSNLPFSV